MSDYWRVDSGVFDVKLSKFTVQIINRKTLKHRFYLHGRILFRSKENPIEFRHNDTKTECGVKIMLSFFDELINKFNDEHSDIYEAQKKLLAVIKEVFRLWLKASVTNNS